MMRKGGQRKIRTNTKLKQERTRMHKIEINGKTYREFPNGEKDLSETMTTIGRVGKIVMYSDGRDDIREWPSGDFVCHGYELKTEEHIASEQETKV